MTLEMRDKENYEKGKMAALFSVAQDGEIPIERLAQYVNMSVADFKKEMEKNGYNML